MNNSVYCGVDVGSNYTKVVLMDGNEVLARSIVPSGVESVKAAENALQAALSESKLERDSITFTVATGYGRIIVPFADKEVTEFTCQAKAISILVPSARTVIDIGGQDVKGMKLLNGRIEEFIINDKCSAGTGRFLDVMARIMEIDINDLGDISLQAKQKTPISSMCTIFAESEVIAHASHGVPKPEIIAGLHDALADRVYSVIGRIGIEQDVVLTGGVALNKGVVAAMTEKLGFPLVLPENPSFSCATGAAHIAQEKHTNQVGVK